MTKHYTHKSHKSQHKIHKVIHRHRRRKPTKHATKPHIVRSHHLGRTHHVRTHHHLDRTHYVRSHLHHHISELP